MDIAHIYILQCNAMHCISLHCMALQYNTYQIKENVVLRLQILIISLPHIYFVKKTPFGQLTHWLHRKVKWIFF